MRLGRELDSMIVMGHFQLKIFYDFMWVRSKCWNPSHVLGRELNPLRFLWLHLVGFGDVHVTLGLQQVLECHVCPAETQDGFPDLGTAASSYLWARARPEVLCHLRSWVGEKHSVEMMGSKDWGVHHQGWCPCYERFQLGWRAHWPHWPQCDPPCQGVTQPSWDLVGWLCPCLLTLLALGLLGLWCKETVNLAKFNEFQVISVGRVEGWWPGADVLAMVEVKVELHAGEGWAASGEGFAFPAWMKGILTTIKILKGVERGGEVLMRFITLLVRKRSEPATTKWFKALGEIRAGSVDFTRGMLTGNPPGRSEQL